MDDRAVLRAVGRHRQHGHQVEGLGTVIAQVLEGGLQERLRAPTCRRRSRDPPGRGSPAPMTPAAMRHGTEASPEVELLADHEEADLEWQR